MSSGLHLLKLTHLQVTTPLLFKLIPAVVNLGVLLRWFSPDSPIEVIICLQNIVILVMYKLVQSKGRVILEFCLIAARASVLR